MVIYMKRESQPAWLDFWGFADFARFAPLLRSGYRMMTDSSMNLRLHGDCGDCGSVWLRSEVVLVVESSAVRLQGGRCRAGRAEAGAGKATGARCQRVAGRRRRNPASCRHDGGAAPSIPPRCRVRCGASARQLLRGSSGVFVADLWVPSPLFLRFVRVGTAAWPLCGDRRQDRLRREGRLNGHSAAGGAARLGRRGVRAG